MPRNVLGHLGVIPCLIERACALGARPIDKSANVGHIGVRQRNGSKMDWTLSKETPLGSLLAGVQRLANVDPNDLFERDRNFAEDTLRELDESIWGLIDELGV